MKVGGNIVWGTWMTPEQRHQAQKELLEVIARLSSEPDSGKEG